MRKFLAECYKIEKLAEKVYTQFAGNSSYSKVVSEIFRKMAADELEHARFIDMVMQTPDHELDATPCLSTEEIDEMLSMTKDLLAYAESERLSANEALRLALQIEEQLVQVHANNSLTPGNAKLAAFFADLSQYDRAHVDQLQDCIEA